ncbi:hypothetical protein F5B17DRAFT_416664, partial [Nemania serpens]
MRPVGFVVSPCVVSDLLVTIWIARLRGWQASRYCRSACGLDFSLRFSSSSRLRCSFRLLHNDTYYFKLIMLLLSFL